MARSIRRSIERLRACSPRRLHARCHGMSYLQWLLVPTLDGGSLVKVVMQTLNSSCLSRHLAESNHDESPRVSE